MIIIIDLMGNDEINILNDDVKQKQIEVEKEKKYIPLISDYPQLEIVRYDQPID